MAFHKRSNADINRFEFTGRISIPPTFEEAHLKKDKKTRCPFISFNMVCNSDDYNNFKKEFMYCVAWNKLAVKINALHLMKGDGLMIIAKYASKPVEGKDGEKYTCATFDVKWLCIVSLAKEKIDNSDDIDDGTEFPEVEA